MNDHIMRLEQQLIDLENHLCILMMRDTDADREEIERLEPIWERICKRVRDYYREAGKKGELA